eukprot:gb/GFBE01072902.1/.p1 GENE.gb/GFBE01072902.1/~~gb/GFBE01072902.1/.p1  ORF type:complete len:189 (+),score=16.95 gb/GFBE01072902.1/:1-567(+)
MSSSMDFAERNQRLELKRLQYSRGRHCHILEEPLPPPSPASPQTLQTTSQSSTFVEPSASDLGAWALPYKGHWTAQTGMRRTRSVIEIDGSSVRWNSGSVSKLQPLGNNGVQLEGQDGRVHCGKIDSTGKLLWDDGGRVWVRTHMNTGRTERCKVCYGIGARNHFSETGEKVKCLFCLGTGKRRPALG